MSNRRNPRRTGQKVRYDKSREEPKVTKSMKAVIADFIAARQRAREKAEVLEEERKQRPSPYSRWALDLQRHLPRRTAIRRYRKRMAEWRAEQGVKGVKRPCRNGCGRYDHEDCSDETDDLAPKPPKRKKRQPIPLRYVIVPGHKLTAQGEAFLAQHRDTLKLYIEMTTGNAETHTVYGGVRLAGAKSVAVDQYLAILNVDLGKQDIRTIHHLLGLTW